jgi:hypothetical protein
LRSLSLLPLHRRAGFCRARCAAACDLLVTTDQEIPHQQNLTGMRISILILCAPTNRLADLKRLLPAALFALRSMQPGQGIAVDLNSASH